VIRKKNEKAAAFAVMDLIVAFLGGMLAASAGIGMMSRLWV
jgi:hypothetical protein